MAITNGYCTLDELKARLFPTGVSDTLDDSTLESIVNGISRRLENSPDDKYPGTGRRFYASTQTRYYTAWDAQELWIDDLLTLTTLKTDSTGDGTFDITWTSSDYRLWPRNAATDSEPYTRILVAPLSGRRFPLSIIDGVEIAGSFGYSTTTPAPIKEACILQCERLFMRKDAVFGVTGSAELGQQLVRIQLDPDVMGLISQFRRRKSWV